ncbi:PIR Superfamily Protein [Plasmodium ovale curtisi]|uniref:PIR Superfamily Protein n=1 Tax=Plasmodium ovale curtisi TaxID=864141 RepID=A0A1A8WPM5_PLAOA|nr:PIR Superfamily Protein [Plasmodium ovale curtisi]
MIDYIFRSVIEGKCNNNDDTLNVCKILQNVLTILKELASVEVDNVKQGCNYLNYFLYHQLKSINSHCNILIKYTIYKGTTIYLKTNVINTLEDLLEPSENAKCSLEQVELPLNRVGSQSLTKSMGYDECDRSSSTKTTSHGYYIHPGIASGLISFVVNGMFFLFEILYKFTPFGSWLLPKIKDF